MENNNAMLNTRTCAYMDFINDECRILDDKVCSYKKCSFYKSHTAYERDRNRDFLYESYLKGNVSKERYDELMKRYHEQNKEDIVCQF